MNRLIVVDIGNTNTRFGLYSDSGVEDVRTIPTDSFALEKLHSSDIPIAVASVVPKMNRILEKAGAFFVSAENALEIDFSMVDADALGADRVANAAALAKYAHLPAICVDCGTAITFELLDSKRVFRGGAIAPGRALMRKSLSSGAAKLPLVSTFHGKRPPALGANTEAAITAGCDIGAIGILNEILAALGNEMGGNVKQVIATGGDAEFFSTNILDVGYGGEDFTLKGIAEIWRMNSEKQ